MAHQGNNDTKSIHSNFRIRLCVQSTAHVPPAARPSRLGQAPEPVLTAWHPHMRRVLRTALVQCTRFCILPDRCFLGRKNDLVRNIPMDQDFSNVFQSVVPSFITSSSLSFCTSPFPDPFRFRLVLSAFSSIYECFVSLETSICCTSSHLSGLFMHGLAHLTRVGQALQQRFSLTLSQ